MKMIEKLRYFAGSRDATIHYLNAHGLLAWIPDKVFLKQKFKEAFGYKLNLKNPKTFNEKTQWLKLYDRRPVYTAMVDKYKVKEFVKEKIGAEHIIPTLGVWDRFEDIDFSKLPDRFVLKCTHDSQSTVICDKKTMDLPSIKKKLNKKLKMNYYYQGREWPYKNIPRKIICEKYMVDESGYELKDYKFFCFCGNPDCVMVCYDRQSDTGTKYVFFDTDWKLKKYNVGALPLPDDFSIPKPQNFDTMFGIAKQLATEIHAPFLRVDLYSVNGSIFFGELTFFPDSGFDSGILPDADLRFGKMITLPKKQN